MLGYRIRRRLLEPAAMHPADPDMGLADVDIADLLVEQLFVQRLLGVSVDLGGRDISPRTHRAGRLGIGGVIFWWLVGLRAHRKPEQRRKTPDQPLHRYLPDVFRMHARRLRLCKDRVAEPIFGGSVRQR